VIPPGVLKIDYEEEQVEQLLAEQLEQEELPLELEALFEELFPPFFLA